MPLYFWGNLTRFVFLCCKVGSVYGIFAAYFVGGLLDLCPPSQERLEARSLDLLLLGSIPKYIEFLIDSLFRKKMAILQLKEDVPP
jgi:hypothetical protein